MEFILSVILAAMVFICIDRFIINVYKSRRYNKRFIHHLEACIKNEEFNEASSILNNMDSNDPDVARLKYINQQCIILQRIEKELKSKYK